MGINPVTNRIYGATAGQTGFTIIDGVTYNAVASVNLPFSSYFPTSKQIQLQASCTLAGRTLAEMHM